MAHTERPARSAIDGKQTPPSEASERHLQRVPRSVRISVNLTSQFG
jgi:hypothetical protein